MHNVHYMLDLMKNARAAIIEDSYPQFIKTFFGKFYAYEKQKYPTWAVDALRRVKVDLMVD